MAYEDNEADRKRIDWLLRIQARSNSSLGVDSTPSEVKRVMKVINRSDRLIRSIDKKFFPTSKEIAEMFTFNVLASK
jgi:hypothetical protein